jgi:hypothetical protein
MVLENVQDSAPDSLPIASMPTDDGFSATMAVIDTIYEESQMAIEEGRDMLNQMIGDNGGDALMGDETAHLKRQSDVTVENLNDWVNDETRSLDEEDDDTDLL